MYLDRNQFSETKLTDEVHNVKSRFKEIFEDIDVISEFHTRASKLFTKIWLNSLDCSKSIQDYE